jgi:hypothetical protein
MTLRIHAQMRHIPLLLLKEEVNMLLLYNKGELEIRNVEGQVLRVEDSQRL